MTVRVAVLLLGPKQTKKSRIGQTSKTQNWLVWISTPKFVIFPKKHFLLYQMDSSICRSQQAQRSTFWHKVLQLFPTDSLPHTYKPSWSCQIIQQVLKFVFIPVDFKQCFARRTTGLSLSSSSSVNFILNEIMLTLSSKMPLRLMQLGLCPPWMGHFYFQGCWLL